MTHCPFSGFILRSLVFPALSLAFTFLLASAVGALTIHVPGDAPSIQAGIVIAGPGDSVVVAPGTYLENLTMRSGIVVTGEGTADVTVVDGRLLGPVVSCESVSGFTLSRLTFARGLNSQYPGGGGVAMNHSSATIVDCILRDNVVGRDGGGISIVDSSALLERCQILRNVAQSFFDGGGVFTYRANATLLNCKIADNLADEGGGIAVSNVSTVTIRNCIVHRNTCTNGGLAGGGLIMVNSGGTVENNTFVGNSTQPNAFSVAFQNSFPLFNRNIIALASGHGLSCGGVLATCTDVWGSGGNNTTACAPHPSNLSADPQFCNPTLFDFTINENSPCAPDHSGGCGLIGALDVGCGVVPVAQGTWGQIKARFQSGERP